MQDEGKNEQSKQQSAPWVFNSGANTTKPDTQSSGSFLTWSASEYIGNPKTSSWFLMLGAASIGTAVIVYLLTSDLVSVIVIMLLAVAVGIFAARQPQVLDYSLDKTGIQRGQRFFPYDSFKTFSVIQDGAFNHIYLLPLKRFSPPLEVHYSPEDEDKIINIFADYLPFEEQKRDIIENFSRRIKF